MGAASNRPTRLTFMRTTFFPLLAILCLALASTAFAGPIYDDGPIDGNTNALFIDGPAGAFGQTISDGFVASASGTPGVLNFGEWTFGTPTGVSWALGTTSFASDLGSGSGVAGSTFIGSNPFGFDVYNTQVNLTGASAQRAGNTYYLTLNGATDSVGGSDAWDVNGGAASCFFMNPAGSGPCGFSGESFTLGGCGAGPDCGPPVPEPSGILLFGSGLLALAGVVRRELNH